MTRGLLWNRGAASRALRTWHRRALAIPDRLIRADALGAIAHKRDNVEGSALFSILPRRKSPSLLRLLVAYQVMWDFLDSVSERGACAGDANGRQLHRALVEALDPSAPISDYYRHHPWKDDGGYLVALVHACRLVCAELPGYPEIRQLMLEAVDRCSVQSINHEPDADRRDRALKEWAEREFGSGQALEWFELTAAASAFTPHALLALAAEPTVAAHDLRQIYALYFPWVGLLIAMLDSYLDMKADTARGSHSYIAHYGSEAAALSRLTFVIERTVALARRAPNGNRHRLLVEGIVAWQLAAGRTRTSVERKQARALVRSGGRCAQLMFPIVRLWRMTRVRRFASSEAQEMGPPGLPLPTAVTTYLFWRSPLAYVERCRARYGKRFTLKVVNHPPLVLLLEPADVMAMLTAPVDVLHPGEGATMITPLVGEQSFMLLDGDEHLRGRRAVTPPLQKRAVEQEADWFAEAVRQAVTLWPVDTCVPLYAHLRNLTLELILRRVFDERRLRPDDALRALKDKLPAMLAVTGSVVFPLPALRRGPGMRIWARFLQDRHDTDVLLYRLIDDGARMPLADDRRALATLMDTYDRARTPLSRRRLRDNIVTMLVSGHETTTSQLAWAFQLLAHNPRVQRRLADEIDRDGGEAYLSATIHEVMRHRPVFPLTVPRAVKRPIEIGGWTYRPPTRLLGCTYLLHHDPKTYPDPYEFRPERFLEGQPSPHTWLPWGGGRRRCPGSHLALLEMKTVLRTVLETMTVHPASRRMERPRWRSVIVTPHAGSRVLLRPREGNAGTRRRASRPPRDSCPTVACDGDGAKCGL